MQQEKQTTEYESAEESSQRTHWHRRFEKITEELFTQVGLIVLREHSPLRDPPRIDIVLQRSKPFWSKEQLSRLPDGPHHSRASHQLWDLKKSQSSNEAALLKLLAYDTIYKERLGWKHKDEVQSFLLTAQTPQQNFFREFEYEMMEPEGVYRSRNRAFRYVELIVLNELSSEPHNMFVKCFASRSHESLKAFMTFFKTNFDMFTPVLNREMFKLWFELLKPKGGKMSEFATSEEALEIGRIWSQAFLGKILPAAEVLPYFKPEEILPYFKPEEILPYFKAEERMAGLKAEEIRAYLQRLEKGLPHQASQVITPLSA